MISFAASRERLRRKRSIVASHGRFVMIKETFLSLTASGTFIRVGAATLGIAIVAGSSSASNAVQSRTVLELKE
jgi:hypothetical protein